jgi:O-antigen/teichoic acid export membrane protein
LSILHRLKKLSHAQSDRIYAFSDQALLGAGNLLTSIAMARVLPINEFAAYTAAVAVYFVLFGFHRALLVMPFVLSGRDTHPAEQEAQWVWLAGLTSLTLFVLMHLVAWAMEQNHLPPFACMVAGFAAWQAPAMLLQEFGRRWLYQHGRGSGVVLSSLVSLTSTLIGIGAIAWGIVPATSVSQLIGYSALFAFVVHMVILPPRAHAPHLGHMADMLGPRMRFSLWQCLTHIPFVIYNQGFPLLLARLGSPLTVAGFSAIRNILNPANSIVSAIDSTDKVRAVKARREKGVAGAYASTKNTRKLILMIGLPFVLGVAISGPWLLPILYKGRYNFAAELAVLAGYYLLVMVNQPYETFLIVNEKGKALFASRLTSATITLGSAAILVPAHHVLGAALSLLAAQSANCLLLALVSHRHAVSDRHKQSAANASQ